MSVLIKGMEIPKSCDDCKLRNGMGKDDGKAIYHCAPLAKWVVPNPLGRADDCPLVPVPTHGRLIDADALIWQMEQMVKETNNARYAWVDELGISLAPTIIEAENVESEVSKNG